MVQIDYNEVILVLPVLITGLVIGVSHYFTHIGENNENKITKIFKHTINSIILCFAIYSMLYFIDVSYMVRIGISSCITLLGIDTTMSIIKNIIDINKRK